MKKNITKKIGTTKTYCHVCQNTHNTFLLRKENNITAKILCPHRAKEVTVSNDADIFIRMRQKVKYDEHFAPPKDHKFFVNHLYITNACNCSCPICYMASNANNTFFMSVDEAVSRVKAAKNRKIKSVLLIGGEPTVHPQLIEIIKAIRKLNVKVLIATNGLELGLNQSLAYELKKAGVYSISLQFDTLNRLTLKKIRGHDKLDLKLKAIKNIQKVNLRFGLICTVSSYNENEIGDLVKWSLSLPSLPRLFAFQSMAEVGRYPFDAKQKITREKIIKTIITSGCLSGAKIDNFWPIPFYRPLGYFLHPDCAANIFIIRNNNKIAFLDDIIDLSGLYKNMRETKKKYFSNFSFSLTFYLFLKNTPFKNWIIIFKYLLAFRNSGEKNNLMMIGTGGHVFQDFEDEQRISRCGAAILTENGSVSLCHYFSRGCKLSC